ncbi:hypothetical protein [Arenibacter sp. P308M17]|nr:hypothetical protein [Arenibacter sp. P308M17]
MDYLWSIYGVSMALTRPTGFGIHECVHLGDAKNEQDMNPG